MLCNKACESLADTNARVVQFREVLLAMEGTAGANWLAAENSLLRVIRARGNRILQKAGHNHMLAMAGLRNRLLLPDAEIALVIIKGDEYSLLRGTTGSPGGTTAPPSMDGGRSTVKLLGSRPQGRSLNTRRNERASMLPPLVRAGRFSQRHGDQQYISR